MTHKFQKSDNTGRHAPRKGKELTPNDAFHEALYARAFIEGGRIEELEAKFEACERMLHMMFRAMPPDQQLSLLNVDSYQWEHWALIQPTGEPT